MLLSFGVILLSVAWSLTFQSAQASHSQFRLQSSTINVAAGKSDSSSFALNSCIDAVMAAQSSSRSFRLQSGCGAAHSTSYFEEGIPALSPWSLALLVLTVLVTTGLYLRGGNSNTV